MTGWDVCPSCNELFESCRGLRECQHSSWFAHQKTPTKTWFDRMATHKDGHEFSNMYVTSILRLCLILKQGIPNAPGAHASWNEASPSEASVSYPLIQTCITMRLLLMLLLESAGTHWSLTFRPDSVEISVMPIGDGSSRSHGNCFEATKSRAWIPWPAGLSPNAAIHPLEVKCFTNGNIWRSLLEHHCATSLHPLFGAGKEVSFLALDGKPVRNSNPAHPPQLDTRLRKAIFHTIRPVAQSQLTASVRNRMAADGPALHSTVSLSPGVFRTELRNQIKIDLGVNVLDVLITQTTALLQENGKWKRHILELLLRAAAKPSISAQRTDSVTHTIHTASSFMLRAQSITLGAAQRAVSLQCSNYQFAGSGPNDWFVIFGARTLEGGWKGGAFTQEENLMFSSYDLLRCALKRTRPTRSNEFRTITGVYVHLQYTSESLCDTKMLIDTSSLLEPRLACIQCGDPSLPLELRAENPTNFVPMCLQSQKYQLQSP